MRRTLNLIAAAAILTAAVLIGIAVPSQANHISVFDGDKWTYYKAGSWWDYGTPSGYYMWCFTTNYQYGPYSVYVRNDGNARHPFMVRGEDVNDVVFWSSGWVWLDPGGVSGYFNNNPPGIGQSRHGRLRLYSDLDGTGPDPAVRLWDGSPWSWPDLHGATMTDVGNAPCP